MPAAIILIWYIGEVYHPMYFNLPLNCLGLMKREDSTGPEGVVIRFPDQESEQKSDPTPLPQDEKCFSCHDFLDIFGKKTRL